MISPAPWTSHRDDDLFEIVVAADSKVICMLNKYEDPEQAQANQLLIMNAPALLSAAMGVINIGKKLSGSSVQKREIIDGLRAAISLLYMVTCCCRGELPGRDSMISQTLDAEIAKTEAEILIIRDELDRSDSSDAHLHAKKLRLSVLEDYLKLTKGNKEKFSNGESSQKVGQ